MTVTTGTKERILDAAETLFSQNGFSGTSMRSIAREADVNLAAANYHFGSKNGLLEEVFSRRLEPLNQERLRRLDSLETAATEGGTLDLRDLLEAFLGPALQMYDLDKNSSARFMRLLGQMFTTPDAEVRQIFFRQMEVIKNRFLPAFARTRPDLKPEEIFWRLMFTIGALAHTLTMSRDLPDLMGRSSEPVDMREIEARLIPFVLAGWRE
jgi:AcrR family transcriptional regulator